MSYWEVYWSDKVHGGHHIQSEKFLQQEAKEKLFHLGEGQRLLDFGCGSADLLVYYTKAFSHCWGIDMSESMVNKARLRIKQFALEEKVTLLHGNEKCLVEGDVQEQNYDVVTCAGVVQHLNRVQIEDFIVFARQNVQKDGKVILFDVIDSRLFLLYQAGLLGNHRNNVIKLSWDFFKVFLKKLYCQYKLNLDCPWGTAYHPSLFTALATKYDFNSSFVSSMYYPYRYHVILERKKNDEQ